MVAKVQPHYLGDDAEHWECSGNSGVVLPLDTTTVLLSPVFDDRLYSKGLSSLFILLWSATRTDTRFLSLFL